MPNHYEIETRLFTLLRAAIEEENLNPDDGIKQLIQVLNTQIHLSRLYGEGRQLLFSDYEIVLEAAFDAGEMIAVLIENYPVDAQNEDSQAGRMISLLVDIRHDLEAACWETEARYPEHSEVFQQARARIVCKTQV